MSRQRTRLSLGLAGLMGVLASGAQGQALRDPPLCKDPAYTELCKSDAFKVMRDGTRLTQPGAYMLWHVLFFEALTVDKDRQEQDRKARARLAEELLAQVHQAANQVDFPTRVAYLNDLAGRLYQLESGRIGKFARPKPTFTAGPNGTIVVSGAVPAPLRVLLGTVSSAQGGRALGVLTQRLASKTNDALTRMTVSALALAAKNGQGADASAALARLDALAKATGEAHEQYVKLRSAKPVEKTSSAVAARNQELVAAEAAVQKAAKEAGQELAVIVPSLKQLVSPALLDDTLLAMGNALTGALAQYNQPSNVAKRTGWAANLQAHAATWVKLAPKLEEVATQMTAASNELSKAEQGVSDILTQVQTVQAALPNSADLAKDFRKNVNATVMANFVEQQLLLSLPEGPARDLALAHGALRALPDARAKLVKSYGDLISATTMSAKLEATAGAVTVALSVAESFGVRNLPPEVSQGVTLLQSGMQLANAYASGNPVAMMSVASSLLGGGSWGGLSGQDDGGRARDEAAAAARHAEVMAALSGINSKLDAIDRKLDQIIALQRETLQKLDDLSQKLDKYHREVLKETAKLETRLDLLLNDSRITHLKPLDSCSQAWANSANMLAPDSPQRFNDYERRKFAYKSGLGSYYATCRNLLNDRSFYALSNGAAGAGVVHSILQLKMSETKMQANQTLQLEEGFLTTRWRPMVALTRSLLNLGTDKNRCASRLLAAMSGAPESMSADLFVDGLKCGDGDLPSRAAPYLKVAGIQGGNTPTEERTTPYLASQELLDTPTLFTLTRRAGDLLSFMLPFELTLPELNAPASLPDLAQLLKYSIDPAVRERMPYFLDVAYWSVAQESLYAGVGIADASAALIEASGFGKQLKGMEKLSPESKAGACATSLGEVKTEAEQYRQIVCLMAVNPAFASNVTARLARRLFLTQGGAKLNSATQSSADFANKAYRLAYYQPATGSIMEQVFSGANVSPVPVTDGGGKFQYAAWTLTLPRYDSGQSSLNLELPSPFQFETDRLVYGPQMQAAKAFLDTTLQRLLYLELGPESAKPDRFKALKRQTVLSNPNPLSIIGYEEFMNR